MTVFIETSCMKTGSGCRLPTVVTNKIQNYEIIKMFNVYKCLQKPEF